MINERHRSSLFALGCLLGCFVMFGLVGCGSGSRSDPARTASHQHDDHDQDHHDRAHAAPADFLAAVTVLRGHFETIRDALSENDVDTAHDPIHEVGHLLEGLPDLAGKAGLTSQDLAAAQAAITAMFEAYGQIDKAIHGGEEADYEAVRDKLDKGMADLDAVAARAKKDS
jgi:hypothetical protein